MAPRPRVLIEPRDLPASSDGIPAARVWDVVLEYPTGFKFRYKRPARFRAEAEALRSRFDANLRRGQLPQLARHWIGLTEEVVGRLMAPPIVRVSRRWEPGLNVIREGETSPTRQASASTASGFRLILVGRANIFQHPEVFGDQEKAERVRYAVHSQLHYGRDLVGHDWELTDLSPCGRTIAYVPSIQVRAPARHDLKGSPFRSNYFIADVDRFPIVRSMPLKADLRVSAMAVCYSGRLQWKVDSLERALRA